MFHVSGRRLQVQHAILRVPIMNVQAFVRDFFLVPFHDDLSARRIFEINDGEGWKEPSILMAVGGVVDLFCGQACLKSNPFENCLPVSESGEGFG